MSKEADQSEEVIGEECESTRSRGRWSECELNLKSSTKLMKLTKTLRTSKLLGVFEVSEDDHHTSEDP